MYIIIGASGYLGSYYIKAIKEMTPDNILATARNIDNKKNDDRLKWVKLDIENREDVDKLNEMLEPTKDNKVIYLAAYHHPDLVEKNPRLAWNINITSLSYVLNKLDNIKYFFYPSTDTVYGEGNLDYKFKEEDSLNPVNRYGRQKVLAEKLVNGYGYNVVRYPFLIGPSLAEKPHFYDNIVKDLKNGNGIEMFADSIRSSLDFYNAAKLVVMLIEKNLDTIPPILNVSSDDNLSKYDIGLMIANKLNVSKELVKPIYTTANSGIFGVPRANITLLDNSKIKNILNIKSIKIDL